MDLSTDFLFAIGMTADTVHPNAVGYAWLAQQWQTALTTATRAEAAFLMGLERNGDLVTMSSYAPLLFNVNDIAWPVSMIGFDSGRVAPGSSYYVQRIFSRHRPDELLATSMIQPPGDPEVFAIAGIRRESGEIIIKTVNLGHVARAMTVDIAGLGSLASCSEITTLRHDDPTAENTLDDPDVVMPVTSTLPIAGKKFTLGLGANSLTILRMEGKSPSAGVRSTFSACCDARARYNREGRWRSAANSQIDVGPGLANAVVL